MTTTEGAQAPRQAEPPGEWSLFTASQTGAAHDTTGQGNQDAVASRRIGSDALVVAVADGHGNKRHFRSARGAEIAADIGCQAGAELMDSLEALDSAGQIEDQVHRLLVPAIVTRWRETVAADLADRPFTEPEEALRPAGDADLIAYGSTLLLALIWRHWLILAQIGDGDVVGVKPDGSPLRPVPGDPALDGHQTTSLCSPHPAGDFRVRAVDLRHTPLLALIIATDGYGNAQAADPWPEAVSADLAALLGERDPAWFSRQLPQWVSRCASAEGSGDDTTVALLIAPGAATARQRARVGLPAVAPTLRYIRSVSARRAEPSIGERAAPRTPALSPRRVAMIAGGVVAVVLLVIGGVQLLAPGAPRSPASRTSPAVSAGHTRPPLGPSRRRVIRAGGVQPLPPGRQVRSADGHAVIILVDNQLWWCRSGTPRPTGCRRLVDLSRYHVAGQLRTCASGPHTMVQLPSLPGQGASPGVVRVTFDLQTLEVSLARTASQACPGTATAGR